MNCEKSREKISAYFDNELSEVEISELNEHIHECERCKKLFDSYKELLPCVKNTEDNLPDDFKVKIPHKNIFTVLRGREGIASVIAAAVALIIFAGGISDDKYMAPVTISPTETPTSKIISSPEEKVEGVQNEIKIKNAETKVKDTVVSDANTKEDENINNNKKSRDVVIYIPEQYTESVICEVETEIVEETAGVDLSKEIVFDDNTTYESNDEKQDESVESEISVASETVEDLPIRGGDFENQLTEILSFQMPDVDEFYDEGVYNYLCEKMQTLKAKVESQEITEELLNEFELLKTEILNAKK